MLTKKAPKELPKELPMHQPQSSSRSSGKGSSQVEQKELIHDFLSGHICEERDHTRFQQQAQLTSLAHEFESSQAKDHHIMELMEKLDKKRNKLFQAQLENVRLQQALELHDLSSNNPSLLENLACTSSHLGLHLPYSYHNNEASPEEPIKLEQSSSPLLSHGSFFPPSSPCVKSEYQSPSPPTHIKQGRHPHTSTTHEVIEILDSDKDQPTIPASLSCDALGQSMYQFVHSGIASLSCHDTRSLNCTMCTVSPLS